tara:strand:+ start:903 stop:1892 length:990 start_codon:yes stop_codon:yes gene_type:complete
MIYKSYLVEENINLINEKITLFYGENLGLKEDLKRSIKIKNKNSQIISLNQENILKDIDGFLSEIYNLSLFETEKIFFIDQVNDKIFNIIKEIDNKLDSQKIYLFSDMLDKKSKLRNYFEKTKYCGIIPCYDDSELTIRKIIEKKLEGFIGLSSENINLIINSSSLDRVKLKNEISKIKTFFIDKKIDGKKLEILLNLKENVDFNLLKDELLNGDRIKTNKLLSNTLIESEKNILYLNIINQRLNRIYQILELSKNVNLENAINTIKPPIFWKDKSMITIQAKKWNFEKIKNALNKTYNLEILFKSNSSISKNVMFKKTLVDICELANT